MRSPATKSVLAGYLLEEFDYLSEEEAAIGLDVKPLTLVEWRKAGIGPEFTVVARRIVYKRDALEEWLDSGGSKDALK